MSDEERERAFQEWCASRPDNVRIVAIRFRPWLAFRMRETGQKVWPRSFATQNDGRVTMTVLARHDENPNTLNALLLGRDTGGVEIFGVDPGDLEPWDAA